MLTSGTGSNMSSLATIHALGDKNYFKQSHDVSAFNFGGDLVINLDAEYSSAFAAIAVDPNLFYHGEDAQARTLMENFRDFVFSPTVVG